MRLFICDDESEVLQELEKMAEAVLRSDKEQWEIHAFLSAEELEKYSEQSTPADIILMDVCLESESGIKVAKGMQEKYPGTQIVFITGYMYTAEEIFEANPCAFLIKPVTHEKLRMAIQRAEKSLYESRAYLAVKSQGTLIKFVLNDIEYIESQKRVLLVHEKNDISSLYMKLDDFMENVHTPILRIHKSYAVNMDKIKRMTSFNVVLENGMTLPVSRQRSKISKEIFLKYCSDEFASWQD